MPAPISLSFDRLEGSAKSIAVLVTDDGDSINFPASLLPPGAKPGHVLTMALPIEIAATQDLASETTRVQDELTKKDPGGDLVL